ncbi:MAG: hypothetical protein O3A51_12770 [Verrucomicrobia bacterium]|nr:hypothetical protein [Verrucomicrobiota bacterium]
MKIETVKATPVTIGFTEPEIWSQGVRHGVTAIVVEVITDSGIVGIGESVPAPSPEVTLAAIESTTSLLLGKDPRQIQQRWLDMQSSGGWCSFPYVGNAALAGIEIALWDILGKSLNASVHALLGGAIRSRVPVMGFVQHTTPEKIENDARDMAAKGYTTLYTKVGLNMDRDLAAASALRRGGGPTVQLSLDSGDRTAHGACTQAIRSAVHRTTHSDEESARTRRAPAAVTNSDCRQSKQLAQLGYR